MSTHSTNLTKLTVRSDLLDAVYRAQRRDRTAAGVPGEKDLSWVSPSEVKRLNSFLREVAKSLKGKKSTDRLVNAAVRRINAAIGAVAGRRGTMDARFISASEISRIADPRMRRIVEMAAAYSNIGPKPQNAKEKLVEVAGDLRALGFF